MKILMFTNTFTPRLGGVTQSILTLRQELSLRGHSTLIVTATPQSEVGGETGVLRVPVLAHTKRADWPLPIVSRRVRHEIESFGPDIIHAHHPFLLGRTALHAAARFDVPIVFTFHTRYDLYLRYRLGGIGLERFLRRSTMAFCQSANAVIAPSESIRCMLLASGLLTPVVTTPSGIDVARVANGTLHRLRKALGIGADAFVIGHIGRLEAEKNLDFLASAVAAFLRASPDAVFLVGGNGTQQRAIMQALSDAGVADRVFFLGSLAGRSVADALSAMDVFVFSSLTETQGLIVAEAQAAGVPVIALDAPGVHETMTKGGGILLDRHATAVEFAQALHSFRRLDPSEKRRLQDQAVNNAARHSVQNMADATEALYAGLVAKHQPNARWGGVRMRLATELRLFKSLLSLSDKTVSWNESA